MKPTIPTAPIQAPKPDKRVAGTFIHIGDAAKAVMARLAEQRKA